MNSILKRHIAQLFSTKEKCISSLTVLITGLIVITPLCGYLFQCGCDWPWLGLDEKCNYYQTQQEHQCPWCVSLFTGVISTILAITAGLYASTASWFLLAKQNKLKEILIRIMFGLSAFGLIAIIMSQLANLVID